MLIVGNLNAVAGLPSVGRGAGMERRWKTTRTLFTMVLILLHAASASARTRDPKPWHILNPLTCCFDDNTGTAAFVASYATKQECIAGALELAKKQTPANCHSQSCASEVWCINVDDSVVAPVDSPPRAPH
jgi:hypothetical protein